MNNFYTNLADIKIHKFNDDYNNIQIIGEIGQNHNGCIENAKKMIDMCKRCNIKFVKFQKRDIDTEFTKEAYDKLYDNPNSFGSTYGEHRKYLEFNKEQHLILKNYAEEKGLIYFCTPCDIPSLNLLEEIGCPFYKVASRDITNIPLLKEMGKLQKTVIISTGMADYDDIDIALNALNLPTNKVIILQCTSEYPCPPKNANLNVIKTLNKKYDNVIGFSDHCDGILSSTLAVIAGATIIEKHITLSRNMKGTDQSGSLEEQGLFKLKTYISDIPLFMGSFEKKVEDNVLYSKNKLMKSLVLIKSIKKDEILTEDNLCLKCPGNGILWKNKDSIIGKQAKHDINADTILQYDLFI